MTCAFAVWTGVSASFAQTGSSHAAIAVVAMIFVYYMFYTIMHPLTYIFITEVFPFVHRAKGVGLTQVFSRGGSAFNQFVNPIGLGNIGWKFYIVYVCWLAVETGIIWFLYPETKGPTLEELADCKWTLTFVWWRSGANCVVVFEDENPMQKGMMKEQEERIEHA
jgi:hypothetical protein